MKSRAFLLAMTKAEPSPNIGCLILYATRNGGNYGPFMINKFENGNILEVPSVRNRAYYPDGHYSTFTYLYNINKTYKFSNMNKINFPILLSILCLTLFSCTYSKDNTKVANSIKTGRDIKTRNKETRDHNKRVIIISKFIDIPSDILESGCGVSFCRDEKEFKEQEFIWVDNSTNGIIKINGKTEKLSAVVENGKVMPIFKNSIYMVTYKILSSAPISDESAHLTGILVVRYLNSNDSTTINVVGNSGC